MPKPLPLPTERTEAAFADYKPAMNAAQAAAEANRCLYCADAPCIQACPTHIDIPEFIRKISTGNVRGSARTIFSANILGMSCARVCPVEVLCEGKCVYNALGQAPIQIGRLQRYATDTSWARGDVHFRAGPDSGRSVGCIGGGPASLAAAHELRRLGHRVVIYERAQWLGGLNTTGVAPYKMRADRALEEVDWILSIGGIEVRTGVNVGVDVSLAELEAAHDALFLGIGLGPDRRMGLPGEDLLGVEGAVAFIERLKLGTVDLSGVKHALVIGGGNTAMDAVRELAGLGVPHVRLVYRRDEASMSAYVHEWNGAKKLGVGAIWRALPTAYTGDGRVQAAHVAHVRTDGSLEPSFSVPADLVLLAIGQARLAGLVAGLDGVAIADGRVVTDADGATGRPGFYAGGDCANGGKEVVNAAAEGKRAAQAIDRYLRRKGAPDA